MRTNQAQSGRRIAGALSLSLLCGGLAVGCSGAELDGEEPAGGDDGVAEVEAESRRGDGRHTPSHEELYRFIDRQVGGIARLRFPTRYEDLPRPQNTDGSFDTTFRITRELVDLGRFLFADPALVTHVVSAEENPACSGNLTTLEGGSCITCHIPSAGGGKAGQEIGINIGGEGLFIRNRDGSKTVRRRVIPGLVDLAPTLTEVRDVTGNVTLSGNCDTVDIVARNPPQITALAYNNRLLLGGLAGTPASAPVNANPDNLPALLNIAQALRIVHRMNGDAQGIPPLIRGQSQTLRQIPAYKLLFSRAYPELAGGPIEELINSFTIFRATAAFMAASTLPREAPFERFIHGDRRALGDAQRRGAQLFFGEARCTACHSGPAFNKQPQDTSFTLVEENFVNIGVEPNHTVQALNAEALGIPDFKDLGRGEITGVEADNYAFRVPTVLQLCGGTHFMHNAKFTSLEQVVRYFNRGVPQSPISGATADPRFTHPRGPGSPRGLGLSDRQEDDLVAFLESLCDPSLVAHDPRSTTEPLTPRMDYSSYDPELAAMPGVVDGMMPSGRPFGSNDPLTRRDHGLEFLDVTSKLDAGAARVRGGRFHQEDEIALRNTSPDIVDTHLIVVVDGLPAGVLLAGAEGRTADGKPYLRVYLDGGMLSPGGEMKLELRFWKGIRAAVSGYQLRFLSGQGDPRRFMSDGSTAPRG